MRAAALGLHRARRLRAAVARTQPSRCCAEHPCATQSLTPRCCCHDHNRREQISKYEADRLKVLQFEHLQDNTALQQVRSAAHTSEPASGPGSKHSHTQQQPTLRCRAHAAAAAAAAAAHTMQGLDADTSSLSAELRLLQATIKGEQESLADFREVRGA